MEVGLAVQGLEDGAVGSHVAEGGPGANLLELEDELSGGIEGEGVGLEGVVRAGGFAEEGVKEIGGELLIGVAVRGREFVEHPEEMVDSGGVVLGDGHRALHKKLRRPFRIVLRMTWVCHCR